MFVVIWRYSQGSPWTLHKDPLPTEQEAREVINKYGRYDMAKRQFRIAWVGDADSWRDPVAEQEEAYGRQFPKALRLPPVKETK